MLRALIRKELREHRLAAAGMLAVGLLVVLSATRYDPRGAWSDVPLRDPGAESVFFLIAMLWGGVLGAMQSASEGSRGTWRFLLHRPAERGRFLLAKILAGALLYAAPLAIPLALLVHLSGQEGRFPAPFDPWDALAFADGFASGTVVYASALALGIAFGASRVLLLVGAMVLALSSQESFSPWPILDVVLPLALGLALSLGAARRILLGPPRSRLAPALLSACGAAALLFAAGAVLGSILVPPAPPSSWTYPIMGEDGVARLVERTDETITIRALDGSLIAADVKYDDARLFGGAGLGRRATPAWTPWQGVRAVSRLASYSSPAKTYWYLDRRRGLVMGYDAKTARPVAWIGPDGARALDTPGRGFVGALGQIYARGGQVSEQGRVRDVAEFYLSTDEGIFIFDCGERRSAERVSDAVATFASLLGARTGRPLVVLSGERVGIIEREGWAAQWFTLPPEIGDEPWFNVQPLQGGLLGIVGAQHPRPRAGGGEGPDDLVTRFYKVDAGGNVVWRAEAVTGRAYEAPWLALALYLASLFPSAIAAHLLLGGRGLSRAARLGWTLFALAGSIPALVALRLWVADEPRLPCPACGRRRAPSVVRCEGCGAGWPLPARREVDLFAEAPRATEPVAA